MFENIIKEWLDSQNLSYKPSGHGYLLCQCPNPKHNDSHPSAFVSLNEGWISCKSCGYYVSPKTFTDGNLDLEELHMRHRFNQILDKFEKDNIDMNEREFSLPPIDEEVSDYRGLKKEFLNDIGAFISRRGRFVDRLVIPFYNSNDELVGYTGRYIGTSDDKSIPKYLHATGVQPSNHILFGKYIKDHLLGTSNTLIVTEGTQDALHLLQLGVVATPSLGFRTPNDLFVIEAIELGIDRIVLAWDNDNAGMDKMLNKKANLYGKWNAKLPTTLGIFDNKTKWLYKSTYKDFGEAGEHIVGNKSMLEIMMS